MQRLWSNFLLAGLLFSSIVHFGAGNPARLTAESTPSSIRSATTLFRNYALTNLPDQRTAGDISKQNRVKHSVTHGGLPTDSGKPAATLHQLLVTTDRSVLYLSFRLSRPGGRAPPASA